MIFVFGGAFSGKGEYVENKFNTKSILPYDAPERELYTAQAVRDFHLFIKKQLLAGKNAACAVVSLIEKNPDIIIISNEIGCGVVPADKFDREYRETVGRIHCMIVEKADRVIRVVCGIGKAIK